MMAEGLNVLTVYGRDRIDLDTPKGHLGGWQFDGAVLTHKAGYRLELNADKVSELRAAIAGRQPQQIETLSGGQIAERGLQGEGWEYSGLIGDGVPMYSRVVAEAIYPEVRFTAAEGAMSQTRTARR